MPTFTSYSKTQFHLRNEIARIEATYGLDKPLPVQYLRWLGNVLRGATRDRLRATFWGVAPKSAIDRLTLHFACVGNDGIRHAYGSLLAARRTP